MKPCPHERIVVQETPRQWGFFAECRECGARGPQARAGFLAAEAFRQKHNAPTAAEK